MSSGVGVPRQGCVGQGDRCRGALCSLWPLSPIPTMPRPQAVTTPTQVQNSVYFIQFEVQKRPSGGTVWRPPTPRAAGSCAPRGTEPRTPAWQDPT